MKLLLNACLMFGTSFQLKAASDTIMWSHQRLASANFKGNYDTAVYNKSHFATTLWKLTYFHRKNRATKQVEVIAYAWFDGRRSWIRPSQVKNTALLQHEQGHFDIAEILTRRFKRQVSQTSFPAGEYADSLRSIFNALLADTYAQQERYDTETQYGEIPAKQRQWQEYIATTLTSLEAFSDKNVFSKTR
jgi:hypothetical protein